MSAICNYPADRPKKSGNVSDSITKPPEEFYMKMKAVPTKSSPIAEVIKQNLRFQISSAALMETLKDQNHKLKVWT